MAALTTCFVMACTAYNSDLIANNSCLTCCNSCRSESVGACPTKSDFCSGFRRERNRLRTPSMVYLSLYSNCLINSTISTSRWVYRRCPVELFSGRRKSNSVSQYLRTDVRIAARRATSPIFRYVLSGMTGCMPHPFSRTTLRR